MYGRFTNSYHENQANVGKHAMRGSSGLSRFIKCVFVFWMCIIYSMIWNVLCPWDDRWWFVDALYPNLFLFLNNLDTEVESEVLVLASVNWMARLLAHSLRVANVTKKKWLFFLDIFSQEPFTQFTGLCWQWEKSMPDWLRQPFPTKNRPSDTLRLPAFFNRMWIWHHV